MKEEKEHPKIHKDFPFGYNGLPVFSTKKGLPTMFLHEDFYDYLENFIKQNNNE